MRFMSGHMLAATAFLAGWWAYVPYGTWTSDLTAAA